ncbi:type III polyketide synthase [Sphingomonas carotinifaciens]|uniref:Type III polyketide synthase n=1 Tax=Sphingomonas carotinifaciens TaxID=1166323 RepID=A0A6N8LS55_9SPHN|nr:type III polyketide synthase [Sphingomonas carotinifaciens]MWC43109.1 type III polyketide synthase [Sphingomonas carotinifaciens]
MSVTAYCHAIGTAVPGHDVHAMYCDWATDLLDPREARIFARMAARAGIDHRFSVLPPRPDGRPQIGDGGFYDKAPLPGTAARMAIYAEAAPQLAAGAVAACAAQVDLGGITHLVVASCTGFVAPGIDQILARRLGLSPSVERLLIGFMGCYAAVTALRTARHIVRSEPQARVLVITVELCTLHLQATPEVGALMGQLQFGDGAAAALVTGEPGGLELEAGVSLALPESAELIRWDITDRGFAMHLSGEVPGRLAEALGAAETRAALSGDGGPIEAWAVHAGGRSILDAVERAMALDAGALASSRAVLREKGNMSSATLMFVLARMMLEAPIERGLALAFGPGLAAEGLRFRSAA